MHLPVDELVCRAILIERYAVERDEAELLRLAIEQNLKIQIRYGGRI